MARSKLKKKKKKELTLTATDNTSIDEAKVPIPNLPKEFLWMKVKSGTKIRNVLKYALQEFSNHNCVVWSGVGQGIGKVITCVEILKRKLSGWHQITKLRYVQSKNLSQEASNNDTRTERLVPEIHILLSKDALHVNEPGYQGPEASPGFQDLKITDESMEKQDSQYIIKTKMSSITAEEFAAMGLRTGQKRPRQGNLTETPTKKTKKKGNKEK